MLESKPPDDEACGEIKCRRQKIGTAKSQTLERGAAGEWPHDAGYAVRQRVEGYRRRHLAAGDDFSDHAPADRHLCGPDNPGDDAGDRDMPDPQLSKHRERTEHPRTSRHDEELRQEYSLAIECLADQSGNRPDKQHRQAAGDDDNGNEKSRVRGIVSKDARDQELEPAHCISDTASKPKAKVIGIRQQASPFTRRDDRLGKHFSSPTVESEPRTWTFSLPHG